MISRIAIVDDDIDFCTFFTEGLRNEGLIAQAFLPSPSLNEDLLHFEPDIITIDLNLNDHQTGIDLLRQFEEKFPDAKKFVISGYLSIGTTVECMKHKADNVFLKPITAKKFIQLLVSKHDFSANKTNTLHLFEWEIIQKSLKQNHFNVSKTADQLGIHRRTLQRKLKKRPYFE